MLMPSLALIKSTFFGNASDSLPNVSCHHITSPDHRRLCSRGLSPARTSEFDEVRCPLNKDRGERLDR